MDEQLGDATKCRLREILSSRKAEEIIENIEKGSCPNCWMECSAFTNIKLDLFQLSKWTLKSFLKDRGRSTDVKQGRALRMDVSS